MKSKILEEIRDLFISDARSKLETLNQSEKPLKESPYRDFLESVSVGKCRICKANLEIVYAEEASDSYSYNFACGHKVAGITVRETITMRDGLKIQKLPKGIKRFLQETTNGWFPSKRKDLSPDGVNKTRIVDREKDYYKEEVIDIKTGRVIRFIEEKLSQHKK